LLLLLLEYHGGLRLLLALRLRLLLLLLLRLRLRLRLRAHSNWVCREEQRRIFQTRVGCRACLIGSSPLGHALAKPQLQQEVHARPHA
jgi:hypothetical protein